MIPYTVERRPDTGVTNVTMGIWLFLASEVMLFAALFSAYALLRISAPVWPHGRDFLSVGSGLNDTVLLGVAGFFVWRARLAGGRPLRHLVTASVVAVLFLTLKDQEWNAAIAKGFVPATNTFLALYFTLTGLHALHVLGGVLANIWVANGSGRVGPDLTAGRLKALSLYWAFVDLVWLLILWLVYLA